MKEKPSNEFEKMVSEGASIDYALSKIRERYLSDIQKFCEKYHLTKGAMYGNPDRVSGDTEIICSLFNPETDQQSNYTLDEIIADVNNGRE